MTITQKIMVKPDYRQDGGDGDAARGVVSVSVGVRRTAEWRSEPLGSYFVFPENTELSFAVESSTVSTTATIQDSRLVVGGAITSSGDVEVTATSAANPANSASLTFRFTIATGNSAPTITKPEDKRYARGQTIEAFVIAVSNEPEGETLTVGVSGLPGGLTYSPTTRRVSGTVAADAAAQAHTVTVTADDGVNDPVTETFAITVTANPAPQITKPGNKEYDRGNAITAFDITVSNAPESDTLTVRVSGLPDGLTYSTGRVSGTVAANAAAQDYTVTVTVSDGLGEPVTEEFTIRVWKLVAQTLAVAADNTRLVQTPFSTQVGRPPINNIPQAEQVARREYDNVPPANFNPSTRTAAQITAAWTALAVIAATTYCADQPAGSGPAYAYRSSSAATVSGSEGWAYSGNQNTYANTYQFFARKTRPWTATCERTVRGLDG